MNFNLTLEQQRDGLNQDINSRAGGNPSPDFTHLIYQEMDSRLRGNDVDF
jgi:hypothetical protein